MNKNCQQCGKDLGKYKGRNPRPWNHDKWRKVRKRHAPNCSFVTQNYPGNKLELHNKKMQELKKREMGV